MASTTAVGLAPKGSAMDKPIGHSSAAAAVLDINWVNRPRYPIVHHRNDYGIGTDAYYLA